MQTVAAGNEACINLQGDMGKLTETEKVPGNANNILQPRFHSTEKKKGRPRKTPLRKPTEEEMKQLLQTPTESSAVNNRTPQPSLPSVAPYPPLRLVHGSSDLSQLNRTNDQPFNEQFQLQPWLRVPPTMIGRRVILTKDGKKQVVIFGNGVTNDNPSDEPDD